MQLTTTLSQPGFTLRVTAPTVIEPDTPYILHFSFQALHPCVIDALTWQLPDCLYESGDMDESRFPVEISESASQPLSEPLEWTQVFIAPETGFGQIRFYLHVLSEEGADQSEPPLEWTHWVSVFSPAKPSADDPLADDLRARLINVVNDHTQNGHIFLADYVRFFADYLNIQVPEAMHETLAYEFGLPAEGLPLDNETYRLIAQGKTTFYGVEKLELIADEDCNASDDRFDAEGTRETSRDTPWEAMND